MPIGNCPQTNPQVYCPHNTGECRPIDEHHAVCIYVRTLEKAERVGNGLLLYMESSHVPLRGDIAEDLSEGIVVRNKCGPGHEERVPKGVQNFWHAEVS
jgi:hypothetical protein